VLLLVRDDTFSLTASRGPVGAEADERLQFDLAAYPDLRRLIRNARPTIFPGIPANNPLAQIAGIRRMQAGIAAPLFYQDRSIGLLLVFKETSGFYSEADARAAMAFANQAAMAIENAQLYGETRRQARQLEAVRQVSQKIISILEMDELLTEVVRLIREKLGYYHVHIFLVDGRSSEIVLRECSGQADESIKRLGLRLKIGKDGITGWVAGSGEPLLCNDVSQEPRYHPHELLPGTRAELAVPLRVGDVVVGVLDVQSEQRDAFHTDDIIALQILSDQVAIAIENAHLFDRTQRQIEAMQVLHDISLDITSRLDTQEVLEAILRQAAHLLRANASGLALLDRPAGVVRLTASYNYPPEYEGATLQLGEGAAGQVVVTGQPVIVNDYASWPHRSTVFRGSPFDAIVSVPLRRDQEVFGALSVVDRGERRPFQEEDVGLLSLLADLACIALKNADLYGQVRQTGEELEQKVERRATELAQAREELARKATELRKLLRLTVSVQEEERTRIARDLHDGSNQLITGTLYELQAAQESIASERPKVALQKLEIAKGLLRNIEAENRRIISGLHPTILDAQGLVPALKALASDFQKRYGIPCPVRVTGQPSRLAPDSEIAVYRIVQEALNNVAAHAQAQRVQIKIESRSGRLRVGIEDDGVGFDYEGVLVEAPGQMGLIGMRERAQSLGGQVEVQSAPGQGTRVALEIPLPDLPTAEPGVAVSAQKI
jgi:signal transduction histidine kinase